ncbi:hypothetical protein [Pseudomonas sp. NFX1]|uniref:hypothetical protein n=1 Tax=Pseudomonas sp. NFX1 TaxID=2201355 RepID=UPI003DA71D74
MKIISYSEKARWDYVQLRQRQSEPASLTRPEVNVDIVADPDDWTLRAELYSDPSKQLLLIIPLWSRSAPRGASDELEIFHAASASPAPDDFEVIDKIIFDGPLDPLKFPYSYELDRHFFLGLGEGFHTFKYRVTLYNTEENFSDPLVLRFDLFPPYRSIRPTAFAEIEAVTDERLVDLGDELLIPLPDYLDFEEQDRVRWYWSNQAPEEDGTYPFIDDQVVKGKGEVLRISGDDVRRMGDGGCYVWYELYDKAGHHSKFSEVRRVSVALGQLPTVLHDPTVNVATPTDGYLVDQEDVSFGVKVHVRLPEHIKPTDRIRVLWGDHATAWEQLGSMPDERIFPIAAGVIRNEYGPGPGDVETRVKYELMRGDELLGEPGINVYVNLETFGPIDPDPEWPDPINKALPLASVYGAGSATENTLDLRDTNQDAELRVRLFETVAVNDKLVFYWDSVPISGAEYTVQAGDDVGTLITRVVPWSGIKTAGNGIKHVHYVVTRPSVLNPIKSGRQDVAVSAIDITPEAPEFLGLNRIGWLSCVSLFEDRLNPDPREPAVRVKVPSLQGRGLSPGESITMSWTVKEAIDGSGDPIDGVKYEPTISLTDEMINDGFIWYVTPYDRYIAPIYHLSTDGFATVTYSFMQEGQAVTSLPAQATVSMHAGTPCDISFRSSSSGISVPGKSSPITSR